MLLVIFAGSLLPYLQCLDSWLYDGILDDPYEEVSKECFTIFFINIIHNHKTRMSYLLDLR
jgi:gamma-tubulin complex component 5